MAKKQEITMTESRIILFLKSADKILCYAQHMSTKLGIDYAYLLRALRGMCSKGWLRKEKNTLTNKAYYSILAEHKDSDLIELASKVRRDQVAKEEQKKLTARKESDMQTLDSSRED